MLCVVTHPSINISGVACDISNVIFTSRLLVKGLNDYRQAHVDVSSFENQILGSNTWLVHNPHYIFSSKLRNEICFK